MVRFRVGMSGGDYTRPGPRVKREPGLQSRPAPAENDAMSPRTVRRLRRAAFVASVVVVALLTSCSGQKKQAQRELTERERNEAIARSPLPGAAVVGRALAVSDREQARAAGMDSLGH